MPDTARLLLLAARLRTMPDEQFNMTTWLSRRSDHTFIPSFASLEKVEGFISEAKTSHCGTTACIAGEAVVLLAEPADLDAVRGESHVFVVSAIARRLLGLDEWQAAALFAPDATLHEDESEVALFGGVRRHTLPRGFTIDRITRQQAARCLEILAETGEVDWRRAIAEETAR